MILRCDELRRWLDEGRPSNGPAGIRAEALRAHALECPSCARELAAAESLELALALAPPTPPSGPDDFVLRILQRIETEPFVLVPVATPIPEPRPARLWWGLLAEPAFVVGAAMLLAVLRLRPLFRGDTGQGAGVAATVASNVIGATLTHAGTVLANALFPPDLHPLARWFLFLGFSVPLLWAGIWGVGAVDRWLRQESEPRS